MQVFKEENNLDLTPDMAQEYLNNMAGLYLSFVGARRRVAFNSEAEGAPTRELIDSIPTT